MDLKTYAVHRKLRYDDNLLSYVVNGEPIPVSVIEASFQGFIAPIEDKKSEKLIENYKEMLASEVPVVDAMTAKKNFVSILSSPF